MHVTSTLVRLSIGKNSVYELWSGSLLVTLLGAAFAAELADSSFLWEAIPERVVWLPISRITLMYMYLYQGQFPQRTFLFRIPPSVSNAHGTICIKSGYRERRRSFRHRRRNNVRYQRDAARRDVSNFYADRGLRADIVAHERTSRCVCMHWML